MVERTLEYKEVGKFPAVTIDNLNHDRFLISIVSVVIGDLHDMPSNRLHVHIGRSSANAACKKALVDHETLFYIRKNLRGKIYNIRKQKEFEEA